MGDELDLSKYQKMEQIGKGSYGCVFKVRNIKNKKIYACKVLISNIDEQRELFERELHCHSTLDNPAIVEFIGYSMKDFEGNDYPAIVTKYMEKGCLSKAVLRELRKGKDVEGWNNTKMVINILGIALGMSQIHENGMIHRDLKPENILLDSNFYPKITDFGTARHLDKKTIEMTHMVGSPLYMAPEICEEGAYDNKADVFSFAMILYEFYTKCLPLVKAPTAMKVIQKIVKGDRPDQSKIPEGPIKDLITRCWSGKAFDRPSFDEIIELFINKREDYWPEDVDEDEVENYLKQFGLSFDPDEIVEFILRHKRAVDDDSSEEEEKPVKKVTKGKKKPATSSDDDDDEEKPAKKVTKGKKKPATSSDDDEEEKPAKKVTKGKKKPATSSDDDDEEKPAKKVTKGKKKSATSSDESEPEDSDDDDDISKAKTFTKLKSILCKNIQSNKFVPKDCKNPKVTEKKIASTVKGKYKDYFDRAIDDDDDECLYYVANSILKGINTFPRDKGMSFKYMKKAASLGNPNAIYGLTYLMVPDFTKEDEEEELIQNYINILKTAVVFQNPIASYVIGNLYALGLQLDKNYIMSLVYIKYAADLKFPPAMMMYADQLRTVVIGKIKRKEMNELKEKSINILNDTSDSSTRSNELRKVAKTLFTTIEDTKLADKMSRIYYQKIINLKDDSKSTEELKEEAREKLEKLNEEEEIGDLDDEELMNKLAATILPKK